MSLTIAQIIEDARHVKLDPEDGYHAAYPYLVSHLASLKEFGAREFVVTAHMAFGWIGSECLLYGGADGLQKAGEALNRAAHGQPLSDGELTHMKNTVCTAAALKKPWYEGKGGSWVAVSKMLHFLRPDLYVIWDSRVGKYLTSRKWGGQRVCDAPTFRAYTEMCRQLACEPAFGTVHEDLNRRLGYESMGFRMSALRALELVMFAAPLGGSEG